MNLKHVLSLVTGLTTIIFLLITGVFFVWMLLLSRPELFAKEETTSVKEWRPKSIPTDVPSGSNAAQVRLGYTIISESPKWIGPQASYEKDRYAGNNLSCKNCHLESGTKAGSASWIGVTERFPQFRGRENKMGTIEERVNGCMERSMNGKKLPVESKQMKAIVAYMEWLSEGIPEDRVAEFKGFPAINIPVEVADPIKGKIVYEAECQLCHGENGEGIKFGDKTKGYQYPPLWGDDTYNHGAGMHRVLTAAQFIKGNMPFGQASAANPKLSDEEAYHVAAYINSFDRPEKGNAEEDFPDKKLKPVSTSYGPWADHFSAEQHKYGPFQPIIAYYKETYNIRKSK
jgi:thiosulfate dehydrogenase